MGPDPFYCFSPFVLKNRVILNYIHRWSLSLYFCYCSVFCPCQEHPKQLRSSPGTWTWEGHPGPARARRSVASGCWDQSETVPVQDSCLWTLTLTQEPVVSIGCDYRIYWGYIWRSHFSKSLRHMNTWLKIIMELVKNSWNFSLFGSFKVCWLELFHWNSSLALPWRKKTSPVAHWKPLNLVI